MLIGKMLKLSQQLNKLSKPILVYLAALQDVPGNPLNFATTLATAATTTTTTGSGSLYYVTSTCACACVESPTAVCQMGVPGIPSGQFDQKQAGPTPFPFVYGYLSTSSSGSGSVSGLAVWLSGGSGGSGMGMEQSWEESVLWGLVVRGLEGLWA
ncbi:hypothetical protein B0T20DRAFT_479087 [Sordaria brevicollis]|uniref:Uncharacterized protein n=1 Tax=Sordaria brevicollis TaxID=83679 RepID=A0AAE0UBR3_SORBR|nr:hypothetical protein B0T20DRAFT_479087 [Sordaria brevicollis]